MRLHKSIITIVLFAILAVSLTACASATPTEDPAVRFTQIASTVQAELTRVAALTPSATPTLSITATSTALPATFTPTGPTPKPTNTPFPTTNPSNLNNSKFVADVTIPDGTVVKAGSTFTKTWRFSNTGKTTWTKEYELIYIEGVAGAKGAYSVYLPKEVKPGETLDISVNFTAPSSKGDYRSKWILYSADGYPFGEYCDSKFTVN
jgi:hypothetical protein